MRPRLPELCRFLGRRHDETLHALMRSASEKRQGTKSREIWRRLGSESYGDLRRRRPRWWT